MGTKPNTADCLGPEGAYEIQQEASSVQRRMNVDIGWNKCFSVAEELHNIEFRDTDHTDRCNVTDSM